MPPTKQSPILNGLVGLLGNRTIARLATRLTRRSVAVVMMHRFSASNEFRNFHDVGRLRRDLQLLRQSGVRLASIDEALSGLAGRGSNGTDAHAEPTVVFTIDDGYADALEVAAPVFAEFDCPVTCFVTPDIVEQKEWYWWDKIDFMLQRTGAEVLRLSLDDRRRVYPLADHGLKRQAYEDILEWIKVISADDVSRLVALVSEGLGVELPSCAPAEYRTLSWAEIRSMESAGWQFGAHSMTHPVLSRCNDERAQWEIAESIATLCREVSNPSRVFCYPVGRNDDFGKRDWEIVRNCGIEWALSAVPGRVEAGSFSGDYSWKYQIPRFSHDDRPGGIIRMLLG